MWGAIYEQGLLGDTVIVSDGAGQFRVGEHHALCWVHAERLVHKLQPRSPADREAVELKRTLIWWLYGDIKKWQRDPDPKRARALRARFDRIFTRQTGYVMLDRLLARLHRQREALLRVLERPEIPLHTNGSENDIRAFVTKRKISGGTVSEAGRIARDTMLGLMKTCAKLGVSSTSSSVTASASQAQHPSRGYPISSSPLPHNRKEICPGYRPTVLSY